MTRLSARTRSVLLVAGVPILSALVVGGAEWFAGDSGIAVEPARMAVAGRAAVMLALVIGALLWASRLPAALKGYVGAVTIGAMLSFVLYVGLLGTPLGVNGVTGDAGFRTALVTHSATFTFPFPDLSYAHLPSWYSPLYYWVLGKVAVVFGLEPYKMVKFGALAVAFVLPVVVFGVWRLITSDPVKAFAAAASLLVVYDTYKISGWIAALLFVPWWVVFVDGAGPVLPGRRRVWVGGVFGGLLFLTYPFYFAVGGMALLLSLAARRWLSWPMTDGLRPPLAILGVAAAVSSPYWLPLVISMVQVGRADLLMTQYFTRALAEVPFPFLELSIGGVLMLIGFGWLVVRCGVSAMARSMLSLVVAVYAWKVVVAVSGAFGRYSQVYRFDIVMEVVLATAGTLALVEAGRWLVPRLSAPARMAAGLLALLVMTSAGQAYVDRQVEHEWAVRARESSVPTAMLQGLDAATGGEAGLTVLSGEFELTVYRPVFLFNTWNAHFAHPAAQFDDRNRFIEELSRTDDPARFAAMAADNEFEPIDVAVFRDLGDTLVYFYGEDNDPYGLTGREILFARDLFDPRYWHEYRSGGFVYFVLEDAP